MLFFVFGVKVYAYDIEVANSDGVTIFYIYINDGKELEVVRGNNKYSESVIIPEEVNYMDQSFKVVSIGRNAFRDCNTLTSVIIPSSVITIGNSAFQGCNGLISINIPSNLESIGIASFLGCSCLESINVEDGNSKYDSRQNCNAIIATDQDSLILGCKNTIIPNSVKTIGKGAFLSCSDLTSIIIPTSVTTIGESAFEGCSGLTSINIPTSVTTIGAYAFQSCSGLTSINIPTSVTTIGAYAFQSCSGLTSINIPCNVSSINAYVFQGCRNLTSISIPNSVTVIQDRAFQGCKLENVISRCPLAGLSAEAFSKATYNHATLYVPEGKRFEAIYDGEWYYFVNIRETTMNARDLSPNRAYTLMNAKTFGYITYDPVNKLITNTKSFHNLDESEANNSWQIVEVNGKECLYNIGAEKYVKISSSGEWSMTETATQLDLQSDEDGKITINSQNTQLYFILNEHISPNKSVTAINIVNSGISKHDTYYTLEGKRLHEPRKGINMIRLSNGKTKKLVVK